MFLQIAISFVTNYNDRYYKMQQVLQIATLLQWIATIQASLTRLTNQKWLATLLLTMLLNARKNEDNFILYQLI